jgi:hypothetical protein
LRSPAAPTTTFPRSSAYHSALSACLHSGASTLRLLPISGGTFAGNFAREIPQLTAAAILGALQRFSAHELSCLSQKAIHMCIINHADVSDFAVAFQQQAAEVRDSCVVEENEEVSEATNRASSSNCAAMELTPLQSPPSPHQALANLSNPLPSCAGLGGTGIPDIIFDFARSDSFRGHGDDCESYMSP